MPLTATFAADMSRFTKSLDEAVVELDVFDRATKRAAQSVKRELEGITGQKVAAEAARMAEAIKRLDGGLRSLSTKELERVNRVFTEFAAKAERMGIQVPPHIAKLRQELAAMGVGADKADSAMSRLSRTAGALGPILPVATAVGAATALIRMGAAAVQSAGHIVDLSNKLGVSTEFIQEIEEVAKLTGTSVDTFAQSAFRLGISVSEGTKKARDAVRDLGLSYDQLKAMKPEDQFRAVIRALESVENAQERNRLGVALFGRQFSEIAASVRDGYTAMAEGAAKSSDAQIRALDRAGDAWTRFLSGTKATTVSVLGGIVLAFEDTLASITLEMDQFTEAQQSRISDALGRGGEGLAQVLRDIQNARKVDIELPFEKVQDFVADLAEIDAKLKALTPDQLRQLNAAIALGSEAAKAYAASLGIGEEGLDRFKEKARSATSATSALNQTIQQFDAQGAITQANRMVQALGAIGGPAKVLPSQLDAMAKKFEEAAEAALALGKMDLARDFQKMAQTLRPVIQLQQRYNVTIGQFVTKSRDYTREVQDQIERWDEFGDVIQIGVLPNTMKLLDMLERFKTVDMRAPADEIERLNQEVSEFDRLLGDIDVGGSIVRAIEGGGDAWKAVAADIGVAIGKSIGRSIAKSMGAGANGQQIGGEIAGGIVGAIIFGVEKLVDGLTINPTEAVLRNVGYRWGVDISEGLAAAIAKDAERMFGGDIIPAILLNMADIIREAGGLTTRNIEEMTKKLRDIFVMVSTGQFTVEQATDAMNEAFGAFAEFWLEQGGLVSEQMLEIIRLAHEMGVESKAINEFITGQITTGANGLATFFEAGTKAAKELAEKEKELAELQAQLPRAGAEERERLLQQIEKITKELNTQKGIVAALAVTTETQAAGAAGALAAMFDEMIRRGMSIPDAMAALQPAVQSLGEQLAAAGLSGGEAFAELQRMAALAADPIAGPVLAAVAGLNQGLMGLHNSGLLTSEMFNGLTASVAQAHASLVEQGFDGDAALRMMQPTLQTIWELQKDFGYEVDATTQALLDQAEASGIVGDAHRSAEDRMVAGLDKIIARFDALLTAFGIDLPQDAAEGSEDARASVAKVDDELGNVNDGLDDNSSHWRRWADDIEHQAGRARLALSTVTAPSPGGRSTTRAGDGDGDTETDRGSSRTLSAQAIAASRQQRAQPQPVVKVYLDGRQIAKSTAPHLPNALNQLGVRAATWP